MVRCLSYVNRWKRHLLAPETAVSLCAVSSALTINLANAEAQVTGGPASGSSVPSGVDRLVLKNGRVLEGSILTFQPGDRVEMELTDGRRPTITWDLVDNVVSQKYSMPRPDQPSTPAPASVPVMARTNSSAVPSAESGPSGQGALAPNNAKGTSATWDEGGLSVAGTFEGAEQRRKAWVKRGGALISYEVRGTVGLTQFPWREEDP